MSTHQVRWPRRFAAGRNLATTALLSGAGLLLAPTVLAAQDGVGDLGFILNTYSFLVWGVLVMWMCAGFTMLEAGSVRSKSASMICMKNIGLYAIAGLTYYIIGYNLMYVDVGSVIGSISLLYGPSADEVALLGGNEGAAGAVAENGHAVMSDWFFQMVFVATTASIVSGALAERVKLWTFFVFVAVLTAIIYPIVGAWTWGGGWLSQRGFTDFAGSTIVHSTGGWAALAGALVVGPRWGKYRKDGSVKLTPPSNIPAVTLGVFILWMGWFGFNGGSELALSGVVNAVSMSNILVNTNLAAAAGVITALCLSRPILGRVDLFATLNGAISGMVAITAGPNITSSLWAIVIGAIGSVLCMLGLKMLEVRRIDDVVGAVPAHLFAGIWGTLATCIAAGGDFVVQLTGVAAVGAFAFSASWILWMVLDKAMGVRVSRSVESIGQDAAELGLDAYPEFVLMVDPDDDNDFRDAD
ncbi:ammonium transporter [Candidatus Palauibacter sp.]|uniref:ammonium transporter n=1 Tax=Candidatus Palauibacter sp. TaxID=3101350 RepID=UPI003B01537A